MTSLNLGEADGLDNMRRALHLALEQGLGRETAVIQHNLAGVVASYEGPQAALDALREAIAFCERRGTAEFAPNTRAASLYALAELGQTQEALDAIGPLADRIQAAGDIAFTGWRGLQLQLLAECGASDHAPDPEELVAAARDIGLRSVIAPALAAAAQLLPRPYAGRPRRHIAAPFVAACRARPRGRPACPTVRNRHQSSRPTRRARARDQPRPARRSGRRARRRRPALPRGRRTLAPVRERARTRLRPARQGRCLAALGQADAAQPLREARELFASMGYNPALAETEALLGETEAAAS